METCGQATTKGGIYIVHGGSSEHVVTTGNKTKKGNQESYDSSLKNDMTQNLNFFCSGHREDTELVTAATAAGGCDVSLARDTRLPPLVSK